MVGATPTGGKPVDGDITFIDDDSMKGKRCIVEVTSQKGSKKHFDAFMNHANQAVIGVYVTLNEPSSGMKSDAKLAGVYHSPGWDKDFPKVQLLTIKELFDGKRPLIPPSYKAKTNAVSLLNDR